LSQTAEKIAAGIRKKGAIPFEEFMVHALYCPNCGYYEKEEDIIGPHGDYYTSVTIGNLLGELLALQIADWLEILPPTTGGTRLLVEAGAHDGTLAKDILAWMLHYRATLCERLEYWIVEPSARRQAWQRRTLSQFGDRVQWVQDIAAIESMRGVVFCNELLDAMPVHRLGWDARRRAWFEWGVTLEAERFVWARIEADEAAGWVAALARHFPQFQPACGNQLLEVLPDGFTIEVCPAAENWWRQAATALEAGKLVAIDYGLTAEELCLPERKEGTLRAFYRHRPSGDVLARPGEQDITAHVNFTAIQSAGESAGLKTDAFQTQARFLTDVAAEAWRDQSGFEGWSGARRRQFQALTHPEHLGRAFRVLVQSRCV